MADATPGGVAPEQQSRRSCRPPETRLELEVLMSHDRKDKPHPSDPRRDSTCNETAEERALRKRLGRPYDRYRAGTPRWLGATRADRD
jgi:hypothetical protein